MNADQAAPFTGSKLWQILNRAQQRGAVLLLVLSIFGMVMEDRKSVV